jgi:flagellar hook-associated protein 3 FlgL
MRIATNSMVGQYLNTINELSVRKQKENARLTSGRQMIDLSDNPAAVMTMQYYNDSLQKTQNYLDNIATSVNEMTNTQGVLERISNDLNSVRDTALQSLQVDNAEYLPSLAANIRTRLESMVDAANTTFNGMFSLAGTKTSADSLVPTAPETSRTPFEIVKETPTASNPSGLRVTFKGNFDQRLANVGNQSTEQVNIEANNVFGADGIEMFQQVIDLYNKTMYRPDGTPRTGTSSTPSLDEQRNIQDGIRKISNAITKVDLGTASVGSRQARLQSIQEQLQEDVTRKKDLLSSIEDTDVAKTIMNMNKEEMSLQYALQVGSKMFSRSLLDFLG